MHVRMFAQLTGGLWRMFLVVGHTCSVTGLATWPSVWRPGSEAQLSLALEAQLS